MGNKTRREFGKDLLVWLGIGGAALLGMSSPKATATSAVGVSDLPNGTLLLDKSIETNQLVFFSVTEQFYDLTTTTSFNAGEQLLGTVEIGFEGDTNALATFIVRMLIEGVEVKTAFQTNSPATGAGDTPAILPQGILSGIRTLTSGGTKTLRIGVVTSGIGNGNVILYNRRLYRIKNASS